MNKPGKKVKVTTSWSADIYEAKTDKQGKWIVCVKSPEASFTPLSVTFDDGEPVTVSRISPICRAASPMNPASWA